MHCSVYRCSNCAASTRHCWTDCILIVIVVRMATNSIVNTILMQIILLIAPPKILSSNIKNMFVHIYPVTTLDKTESKGSMMLAVARVDVQPYLRSSSLPEEERMATMVTHTRMTEVMRAVPKVTLTK